MKKNLALILTISYSLILAGCGSDDNNSSLTANQASRNNQFQGIIVNITPSEKMTISSGNVAVVYDTNGAVVISDGGSALHVGKVVKVDGVIKGNVGKAKKIHYDSDVEGFVLSINTDPNNNVTSIVVMGQTVFLDDMTVYKDGLSSSFDITVGMNIEVSGIQLDSGILAKYVELKNADDHEVEIKGIVAGIPEGTTDVTSFKIGDCTINIDPAITMYEGFVDASEIMNGMEVEVKSNLAETNTSVCTVTAIKIELEDKNDDYDESIKGVIISALDNNRFMFTVDKTNNNIIVALSTNTRFIGGTITDILVGGNLKIEGTYNLNGELNASLVKFIDYMETPMNNMVKIEAFVESIDTLSHILTVLGQTITFNDMTMTTDGKLCSDITVGDFVKIKAIYVDSDFIAKHITVKKLKMDEVPMSRIDGVATVDMNIITVEGVKIIIPLLDPALPRIANGDHVVVAGTYDIATGGLIAESIKISSLSY